MANTGSLIPIHSHTNLALLELFSETEDKVLLYRGKKIASVQEMIDFRDDFNAHVNNTDIHVTKNDKDGWDEHVADTVIHVTQADKDLWNATLQNAKTYAKNLFDQVTSFKIHIVSELPTQDIEEMAIYFVRVDDPLTDNLYDEYMYIDNKWEIVGSLGMDFDAILSQYLKISDFNTKIANYYTKSQVDTKFNNYYTKSEIDELLDGIDDAIEALHTHDNKDVLDKLSTDSNGHLLYNDDVIGDYFTESDVREVLRYLWPLYMTEDFITADNKIILTADELIFTTGSERG